MWQLLIAGRMLGPGCECKEEEILAERIDEITEMKQKKGKRSKRVLGKFKGVANSIKYSTADSKKDVSGKGFWNGILQGKSSPPNFFSSSFELLTLLKKLFSKSTS